MEISRLRVSGFKSFSDPVELQLEAGLTGIVGPNGCGKSNIVEALRWAMGESSAKGLRGDGMEDVIFNGSATRPAHDVAEVRLKLRGRPEGLAGFAEEGELEVARRIGRGTGSVYRINGREARARDVQMLFADAGAGSRSPAIIGQGQIGFIVDSRPADRRRLLEEAAGIGGLQARRREAELRLEATRANLQRVVDLLTTQEDRLADLTKQSRQAERYRQLAAELRTTEAHLLLARHTAAARQAAAGNAAVAELGEAHERRLAEVAELRRSRNLLADLLPGLREALAAAQVRSTELRERLNGLREASAQETAHLAAIARQRDEAAADLDRATRSAADLAGVASALTAELAEVERDREAGRLALATRGGEDTAAATRLAAAQASLRDMLVRTAEAAAQRDAAQERVAGLQARLATVRRGLDELPETGAARTRQADADARAAALGKAVADAKTALASADALLRGLVPEREAQRTKLSAAEHAAADCRERLAVAETQLREAQAATTRLAERRAVLGRAQARLDERRVAHADRAEALAAHAGDADVATRAGELATAEAELAAADAVLDRAREALGEAEHARTQASAELRQCRRSADAVEAEIKVLESLAPPSDGGGLLARIDLPTELTGALAAALGDDLLAGTDSRAPRFWRDSASMSLSPLPAGAIPMLELVKAPVLLQARLAQIGVIDPAEAPAAQAMLRPGQRLVSRDGGLWRWDGFVRAPGAEDAATARVRHQFRLHAAREELAALARALGDQEAVAAAAELDVQASRARLHEAETGWRAADSGQLQARQRRDDAAATAQRLAEESSRLAQEREALAREAADLAEERGAIDTVAGSIANVADLQATVERERGASTAAGEVLVQNRAAMARLDAAHAEAERRHEASIAGLGQAAAELEHARAAAGQAGREAGELEAERRARESALAAELSELATGLAEAEAGAVAAVLAAAARRAEQTLAEEQAANAEADRRRAGDALARLRLALETSSRREESLARSRLENERRREDAAALIGELRQRVLRLEGELAETRAGMRTDPAATAALEHELATVEAAAAGRRAELVQQETAAANVAPELEAAEAALATMGERLAVAQAERVHAHEVLAATVGVIRERLQHEPLALLDDPRTRAAVAAASVDGLEARLAKLRAARERLGPVNLRADVEATELQASVTEMKAREAELQQALDRLRTGIGTLDREARGRLMATFEAVDGHFRRLFAILFGGGKAHLCLTGADDPLQAGLELEASPPGKKLSSISLLSGGEKTLAALALVFAFFLAEPSPLCVLDEVDAPLDDANVDRFVGLMQQIAETTTTRFLVVTHHPLTMARMDRLYGVTMAERGISRLVSVALERALELRATA